jgi:hypothetical protein
MTRNETQTLTLRPETTPREFNILVRDWLVENRWHHCISDPCINIFRTGAVFAMIAIYANDILTAYNDATWLSSFKA